MNFVELLLERSRDSDGDIIAVVKGALTSRELHEKVDRFSELIAWKYGPRKEFPALSGNSESSVLDMPLSSSNKVRILEMLSRGEILVR